MMVQGAIPYLDIAILNIYSLVQKNDFSVHFDRNIFLNELFKVYSL